MHGQAAPESQNDDRPDRCTHKPRALIRSVPADTLTQPCGDERTGDTERGREDEAAWVIRPRQQKSRYDAGDEAYQNDPDEG